MKTEFQAAIAIFLKMPIADVRYAEMPDGLKIIAFKAMLGADMTVDQRDLLSQFAVLRQVELVRNMTTWLDFQACLDPSEYADIPTPEAIHEFVEATITAAMDSVLPPLKVLAANRFVNTYHYSDHTNTLGTPGTQGASRDSVANSEKNTTLLSPDELNRIYLCDPSIAKKPYFGLVGDLNVMMAAVVQRHKAIDAIHRYIKGYPFLSIAYQLNRQGDIDIEQTLLKLWQEQVLPTVGRVNFRSVFELAVRDRYLVFAQWLWQATPGHDYSFESLNVFEYGLAMAQWGCQTLSPTSRRHQFEERYAGTTYPDSGLATEQWKWNQSTQDQKRNSLREDNCSALSSVCSDGNMVLALWLMEIAEAEDRTALLDSDGGWEYYSAFFEAVVCGHLALAQWLWRISTSAQREATLYDFAMRHVATQGHLLMSKWLWQCASAEQKATALEPRLVRNEAEADKYKCIFYSAVENGQLALAQWIWHVASDQQQRLLLESGHLNIFSQNLPDRNLAMAPWIWGIASPTQRVKLLEKVDGIWFRSASRPLFEWVLQIAPPQKIAGMLKEVDDDLELEGLSDYRNVEDIRRLKRLREASEAAPHSVQRSWVDMLPEVIVFIEELSTGERAKLQAIKRIWGELLPAKREAVLAFIETQKITFLHLKFLMPTPSVATSALTMFTPPKESKRPLSTPESDRPVKIHAHAEESPHAHQVGHAENANFSGRAEAPIHTLVSPSKKRERTAQDEELIELEDDSDSFLEEWPAESDNMACKHQK